MWGHVITYAEVVVSKSLKLQQVIDLSCLLWQEYGSHT
jgi:hypothetical protein